MLGNMWLLKRFSKSSQLFMHMQRLCVIDHMDHAGPGSAVRVGMATSHGVKGCEGDLPKSEKDAHSRHTGKGKLTAALVSSQTCTYRSATMPAIKVFVMCPVAMTTVHMLRTLRNHAVMVA